MRSINHCLTMGLHVSVQAIYLSLEFHYITVKDKYATDIRPPLNHTPFQSAYVWMDEWRLLAIQCMFPVNMVVSNKGFEIMDKQYVLNLHNILHGKRRGISQLLRDGY